MPISAATSSGRERALWVRQPDRTRRRWDATCPTARAIVGALLIKGLFPASMAAIASLGTPSMSGAMGLFDGIVPEALFTFFPGECRTALPCAAAQRVGGLAIGFTCWHAHWVRCLTGPDDPARAFGPALVSWDWHGQRLLDRTAARAAAGGALWSTAVASAARRT